MSFTAELLWCALRKEEAQCPSHSRESRSSVTFVPLPLSRLISVPAGDRINAAGPREPPPNLLDSPLLRLLRKRLSGA